MWEPTDWIEKGNIELGWVIDSALHGRGYATAAVKKAIEELFENGFREIRAGAFAENAASIRVMEKSGMKRLPLEEKIEYRGKIHRCVYYGIHSLDA